MAELIPLCFDQYLSPNDIQELCTIVQQKIQTDIRNQSPEDVEHQIISCVQDVIGEYSYTANDNILKKRWSEYLCGRHWKKMIGTLLSARLDVIDPLLHYATTKFAHIPVLVQSIVDLRLKGHQFFCENVDDKDTWIDDCALIVRSNGTVSTRKIHRVNLNDITWLATEDDSPFSLGEPVSKSILCAFHVKTVL